MKAPVLWPCSAYRILALGFLFRSLLAQAPCTDVVWRTCVSGDFSDKNNWAPCQDPSQARVPGPNDTAIFQLFNGDATGPFTVTINGQTTAATEVTSCPLTFNMAGSYTTGDLGANDLTVTGPGPLQAQDFGATTLTLSDGTVNASGKLTASKLTVGASSTLHAANLLPGAPFVVREASQVSSDTASLGASTTVDGNQSGLTVSGTAANQGTLTISNGGMVSFGAYTSQDAADVKVTGTGSQWSVQGTAEMGLTSQVEVSEGGHASCGTVVFDPDAANSPSSVDGSGSLWSISGRLGITFTDVEVANGGQLTAADLDLGSQQGTRNASLTVQGSGSSALIARTLNVLSGGQLNVSEGGKLQSDGGFVGVNSAPANVTVTDPGSVWILQTGLSVGDKSYGTMSVANGGRVDLSSAQALALGTGAGTTGLLTVQGNGATVDASGAAVAVGEAGYGELTITNTGRLIAKQLIVGDLAGAGGSIWIQGSGSELDVVSDLILGQKGSGGMTVSGGAAAGAGNVRISVNNTNGMIVTDPATSLQFTNHLDIGGASPDFAGAAPGNAVQGNLGVLGGAQLLAGGGANSIIAVAASAGSKGTLQISGPGSVVSNPQGLTIVGVFGAGTLLLQLGASADLFRIAIGTSPASGTVNVGSGSMMHVRDLAAVGGASPSQAGPGFLFVNTGGLAQIDHKLLLFSQGLVSLTGGEINVGDSQVPPVSTLRVSRGGILAGKGKVVGQVLVGLGGKVVPGGSDGTLTIQGDYTQTAGSELSLNLAGPTPDTGYDVLKVTGNATLAGQLTLNFIDGFAPKANQSFDVIRFGTNIVGQFDQIQINGLAPGFLYQVQKTGPGTFSFVAQNDGTPTTTASGPLLSIARLGPSLVISWPTDVQGYNLQSTPDLGITTWTNVPTISNQLTVTPTAARQFFRLMSP